MRASTSWRAVLMCFAITVAVASASGCSQSDSDGESPTPKRVTPAVRSAAPVAPRPPLTKQQLLAMRGAAVTGAAYDPVRATFNGKLGRSIYADRVTQWWAVVDGDSCWAVTFDWDDDKVGRVMEPREFTAKDGFTYRICVVAAAKNACFRKLGRHRTCAKNHPHPEQDSP